MEILKTRVMTRRDFLRMVTTAAAALGLSQFALPEWSEAALNKPAVIWLHGQECTGCTESVISVLPGSRSDQPDIRDVILDVVEFKYQETIMAAAGAVAEHALEEAILAGGYVLVMEGSIPAADPRFLKVAGKPLEETFVSAARNAAVIFAIGACATWGGLNAPTPSQGRGVEYWLNQYSISKPYVNIPGCSVKPEWFFGTLIHYLQNGTLPPLDSNKRPSEYFSGRTLHQQCPRNPYFENKLFLTDWNDPSQANYCLALKGCKGRWTKSDCPNLLWNDGVNWCIGSGAPCAGCTEPVFYDGFSPLYT
ncbi:MAG: hydrogenase small subunit [Clostridia bacterium]|jgi:hydrogenase small subunit|nr:hydrogenase small subunit [Clostridia bacterium]